MKPGEDRPEQPCANSRSGCQRPARMAVRTFRRARTDVRVMVWPDNRTAPVAAEPYCRECGMQVVRELLLVLVDIDGSEVAS